ncbi:hypothetical protein XM53_09790 [Roseovarius atlanticus]|uniref:Methyltransferase domain-containing protein n=1 Tax=Roseovarius atlanticus TaxID=1641875 RepID=A0A0T5NVR2_9RHOB|nr:hypothetical protein XM53_09790 [Roseovarius atlanticus]
MKSGTETMVHLLIGPSNSGKSHWIEAQRSDNVAFAFQHSAEDLPPPGSVLHYNLLFCAPRRLRQGEDISTWNLLEDPLLETLLNDGHISEATVIVAPLEELNARSARRKFIEPTLDTSSSYNADLWQRILASVDLFAIYQDLFDLLEDSSIPYRVVFNSEKHPGDMAETDRCFAHAALRGTFIPRPDPDWIESVVNQAGAEYQAIRLPAGRQSGVGGHTHTNGPRHQSFDAFREGSLVNGSVLDIGCAMGEMLYCYERFGATRLLGLDVKEHRLAAARTFAQLLHSSVEFRNVDFLSVSDLDPFDDVLALNVLHHVDDVRGFLKKACALTLNRLIIEFPLLSDPKFNRLGEIPAGLDDLPLMGVSSRKIDQTFVFTSAALVRLVDEFGSFSVKFRPSPIAHRRIAIFSRTENGEPVSRAP